MAKLKSLFLAAFGLLGAWGAARADTPLLSRDHPLVGRIYLPAEGRMIDPAALFARLARADLVFLGEKHDNPDHHRLEALVIRRLVEMGRRPAIAFEMLTPEQMPALSAYLSDHPNDTKGLGAALGWDKSGWPSWEWYRPVFAQAVLNGLPVRSANLSPPDLRAVVRGQMGADAQPALADPLPTGADQAMAEEIRAAHCGMLPESAVGGMVAAQKARDGVMARALLDGTNGAVLVAGAGHTRTDRGAPYHLTTLAPNRSRFSLAFREVEEGRADPAAYADGADGLPYDAVWFTPRTPEEDHCAQLQKAMQARKANAKGP